MGTQGARPRSGQREAQEQSRLFRQVAGRDSGVRMKDFSTRPAARLFTSFGTVLYIDASGELRHGAVETSPENAFFAANQSSAGPHNIGCFVHDAGGAREPIVCLADR